MSTMPRSAQSELFANPTPGRRAVATPVARPDLLKDPFQNRSLVVRLDALDKVRPLAFGRYLSVFFVGVVATLAWQRYGGAAREMIAPTLPSASQEQLTAMSVDIETVRQNVDRMITG